MSQIARTFFRLFGLGGASSNFGQFGSKRAGTPTTTKDVTQIQALDAWTNGLQDAVVAANKAPYLQDMNGLLYAFANQIAYILQGGIPEWDSQTTYFIGSVVRWPNTGLIFQSLVDDNTNNALPGTTSVPISNSFWQYTPLTNSVPPGTINAWGGPKSGGVIPAGWLLCDGTSYNRADYPALFDQISTAWGIGTNVPPNSTFRVPDLRGRTLFGADGIASSPFEFLSTTGGEITHTHTQPAHSHAIGALSLAHQTDFGVSPFSVTSDQYSQAGGPMGINPTPSGIGAVDKWKNISAKTIADNTATSQPAIGTTQTIPPYAVVTYIIKT